MESQGEKVRGLKATGADKVPLLQPSSMTNLMRCVLQAILDAEVATLLSLKAQYKALTGTDLAGGSGKKKSKIPAQQKPPKGKKGKESVAPQKVGGADGDTGRKKQTR